MIYAASYRVKRGDGDGVPAYPIGMYSSGSGFSYWKIPLFRASRAAKTPSNTYLWDTPQCRRLRYIFASASSDSI